MKKEDNNYMYKNIKIIIIQSAKRLLNVTIVCFISLNIYVFAEDKLQIQSTCIAGKFQVTETLSYKLKCSGDKPSKKIITNGDTEIVIKYDDFGKQIPAKTKIKNEFALYYEDNGNIQSTITYNDRHSESGQKIKQLEIHYYENGNIKQRIEYDQSENIQTQFDYYENFKDRVQEESHYNKLTKLHTKGYYTSGNRKYIIKYIDNYNEKTCYTDIDSTEEPCILAKHGIVITTAEKILKKQRLLEEKNKIEAEKRAIIATETKLRTTPQYWLLCIDSQGVHKAEAYDDNIIQCRLQGSMYQQIYSQLYGFRCGCIYTFKKWNDDNLMRD